MTEAVFYADAYAKECEAKIVAIEDGAIVLDRTVFYPNGGGQPGDSGELILSDGQRIRIADTRKGDGSILHLPEGASESANVGAKVTAKIDWERRHRHMRMHTSLHLLCSLIDAPVTGGSISAEKGRLDFDLPESTLDKEALSASLAQLADVDAPISVDWISDEEMAARPELVRTMSVKPPSGQGKVRLINIHNIDLQPCGGTHVTSTREIGSVRVRKIEKKGRQNRRVILVFDD
ncbi:MAG: alanyl-tRNA editing protein [Pseudomonadota bacterium]